MKITIVKKAQANKVRISCSWIIEDMENTKPTK